MTSRTLEESEWYLDWLWHLGVYQCEPTKFVLIGLENSGKSALLEKCAPRLHGFNTTIPGSGSVTRTRSKVSFIKIDIKKGDLRRRELWRKEIEGASAIIFVVDAQDATRFSEAVTEFHSLTDAKGIDGVPFLVLRNKIDLHGAIHPPHILSTQLMTDAITSRSAKAFMCSVLKMRGYQAGFRWLASEMLRREQREIPKTWPMKAKAQAPGPWDAEEMVPARLNIHMSMHY